MKVRQQAVSNLKLEPRANEKTRLARPSFRWKDVWLALRFCAPHQAVRIAGMSLCCQCCRRHRSRLQRTIYRRTDRNHSATSSARLFDSAACGSTYRNALGMHHVRVQIIRPQWLKSACPHMQCYKGAADARLLDAANQLRVEVQTRRRGSYGAPLSGENTLVPLSVILVGGSMNVRRKRYIAPLLEEIKRWPRKSDPPQIVLTSNDPRSSASHEHFQPLPDRLAGAKLHESFVFRIGGDTLQEYLYPASRGFCAHEPRCDDLRVVEAQQIVGAQKLGEVTHAAVACACRACWLVGGPFEHQQPTRRSLGEWGLGNQVGRQVVGEVMALHAANGIGIAAGLPPGFPG